MRSSPLACVRSNALTYVYDARHQVWRRSISQEVEQRKLFQQAQAFLQTGEAESAKAICTEALGRYPEDANFLCLSARVLLKLKKFDEANTQIKRALSIFPEFASPYGVRGELLLAQGQPSTAIEAFQKSLEIDPKQQRIRMKLVEVLMYLGRVEEARAIKEEFIESSQDNKDIARAAELEIEEKYEEAEEIYRQILIRNPDNVSTMRLWARLGREQKRYPGAEVLLLQAVKVAPGFKHAWADLCSVQFEQEKYDDTIESAKRLIKLKPGATDGHMWLAVAAASAGRHPDALEAFNKVLKIAPDHVGAWCGKGNAYRTIGDQGSSITAFRKSLQANPLHVEAYWSLANLKTFRFENSEVDDMLALLGDERIPPEGQVQLNNALGLEFESRKEYNRAFGFIERGNILRRSQEFYDRVENEEKIDLTIKAFARQFLADNAGHGDPEPAPIFIVGLPRSGSTLLEQILSSHSIVDGTFELGDLGRTIRSRPRLIRPPARYPTSIADIEANGFKRLGSEYIERTRRHRGSRPFFTDKNPNNFVHVGLIHLILPNAKIINARRHPLDSCFGSYKQLFAQGQQFTYDLVELGEYYLQYQRLMDHWHKILPGKVLDVQYEDVVADLEGQVRRILEYCELDWEESCLRFHETNRSVKTASSEQVRQPLYSSAVHTWRHYEPHLGALIEVLEPLLVNLPGRERPASMGGSAS
ncbi:MAG: sulfotransferase [Acidiferrobacterales bacterium]